jgi:ubiquinone/menaquinone biosynthesis C-methylase UbiE
MYRFHPPKIIADPFMPYPQSVYECMDSTLDREELNGGIALDLGSGQGEVTRILAKRATQTIAFDRYPLWHTEAKRRLPEKGLGAIDYVTANLGSALPIPDQSVDRIASSGLTAYIPPTQLPFYMQEIKRVLKPGGSYFEPEMDPRGYWKRHYMDRVRREPKTLTAYLIGTIALAPHLANGTYPHDTHVIEERFQSLGFEQTEYAASQGTTLTGVSVMRFRLRPDA